MLGPLWATDIHTLGPTFELQEDAQPVSHVLRFFPPHPRDVPTAMGVTVVDSMVISLARIQEELVRRRETLTAEGALVIFQSQLEPAPAGI
jgi:hypothetical protein